MLLGSVLGGKIMAENVPIEPKPAKRNPFSPSDRRQVESPTVYDPYARTTTASSPDEAKMARLLHKESIALERMKEADKTRRLWHALAVASILVAALIVTFAPSGRELLSYWIGGALVGLAVIAGLFTLRRRKARSASTGSAQYSVVDQDTGKK
jgi:hypothetical protein